MSSAEWTTVPAAEVRVGDRLRTRELEMTVTRIDPGFFGRPELLAFVEDSDEQWLKVPTPADSDVEVARG